MNKDITNKFIPSFDLTGQIRLLQNQLTDCYCKVLSNGSFILDKNVKEFECSISKLCQVDYGIGVASGSDALYLSLIGCGIAPGDEVITTPFTFIATANSITRAGAKPVFVDIDTKTWNINPELIEEKITSKTKAIMPVHLYGCPCKMDSIVSIAKKYKLKIIEDSAQAIGSKYQDKSIGSFGDTGCFSFYPTKNLGAFGDGGMIVTNDSKIAEKLLLLRSNGAKIKYYHDILGFNSRLDELQASILNVKLKYLNQWTVKRRNIAKLYNELLYPRIIDGKLPIQLPIEPENAYHVYHQYTIQAMDRNKLKSYLEQAGIGSTIYYPKPVHLQRAYIQLNYKLCDFPVTERACNEVLSLPMFPELTEDEAIRVANSIISFYAQ
nr:DegT/DnrJ/EryC1/StrS family aminotransferase [Alkaliphilus pronyensis]